MAGVQGKISVVVLCVAVGGFVLATAASAELHFVGSQYDIGGKFFPGYNFLPRPPGQCCFVPWRSDSSGNVFAISNVSPNRYYGTAGWALFGTMFEFPNANTSNFNIDYRSVDDPQLPNLEDLPDFVAASQILAHHKAGADYAALIDDPRSQAGIRWWTFDGTNHPPPDGTNTTGSVPYLKTGYLHGWDEFGHDPTNSPAGRWGFLVGDNPPQRIRIGVMTDGLSDRNRAPEEVYLIQVDPNDPYFIDYLETTSTGSIPYDEVGGDVDAGTNRFVDMHFFDITNPQPGDVYAIAARAYNRPGHVYAGVNGISFDVLPRSGDYNGDGLVDAADYVTWRNALDQIVMPGFGADGDYSGTIDQGDYAVWRGNFGNTTGSGAASSVAAPEPSTVTLILGVAAIGVLARRRTRV